ncbi:MAG: alpha/beta hydrolase [Acidobacteria bacterium]|nr:alpha/beta hydrolase [Acidobacteriota bacterium]
MNQLEPQYSGLLDVGDHTIHWEYFGDRDREAVCLLNGLAMHTKAWYGFLPQLLDDYDVLLYDYPGQGESSKEDVPYSIPLFADYLARIMDLNEVDKVHLMGISYGGFVALDFARLYRERLHTLVLSGIILSHEKLFQMYQEISLRFYRSTPEVFDLYTHYMYEKIFGEPFVSKLTDEQLDAMRQRFYDRYVDLRHCLIRLTEAQDPFFAALDGSLQQYRSVKVPTLVVAGEQDRAIPLWAQRKLCDIFTNSRWELLPGSGHVVYLERPDLFFPLLKRFMKAKSVEF